MNERIRELAEQSGFVDRGNNITAYMNFDHEKFAEMIVKECVLEAMDAVHHNNSIRLQLYKHFGLTMLATKDLTPPKGTHDYI